MNTAKIMKCPKCGSQKGIVMMRARVAPGDQPKVVKCVAYCCEDCQAILGVESDPIERDAQMNAIKATCEGIESKLEALATKEAWRQVGKKDAK